MKQQYHNEESCGIEVSWAELRLLLKALNIVVNNKNIMNNTKNHTYALLRREIRCVLDGDPEVSQSF